MEVVNEKALKEMLSRSVDTNILMIMLDGKTADTYEKARSEKADEEAKDA